jgi:hypothetical protein
MSPDDARLLDAIDSKPPMGIGKLGGELNLTGDRLLESADNLLRLRLCVIHVPQAGEVVKRVHLSLHLPSVLELTVLGRSFLGACRGPSGTTEPTPAG